MSQNKLKVMQVLGAKTSGGAEVFYLRFVKALRHRVDLLCVVREGSWMEGMLRRENIPYVTAPFKGFLDEALGRTQKKIAQHIEEFQPDIVQGWMNRACKHLPKTKVATVGRLGGFYNLKNYKNCDYLVGNTKDIQQYVIEQGHQEDKSFYIPNFAPMPDEKFKMHRSDVRLEYGIPEEAKVLFMSGRLHSVKGVDLAIKTLRSLPKDVHLLLAGSGPEEKNLKMLVQSEGLESRVHFMGWVNELSVVASAADIWLVPSRHEPLGNVVLDAWAHEIPVIASETHGPKSLIEHDVTGKLFPINDMDTMAREIDSLLKSPKQVADMAEKGLEVLKQNFSEGVVLEQYLNFYRDIA